MLPSRATARKRTQIVPVEHRPSAPGRCNPATLRLSVRQSQAHFFLRRTDPPPCPDTTRPRRSQTGTRDGKCRSSEAARFDAAFCRLGLMFLPNPWAGLKEIHRALKSGGRFCSRVFTEPEVNPCLRMLMSAAMRQAGLAPRDPFQPGSQVSLGKPGLMDDLMQQAGFRSVATPWMKVPFRLPTTDD
ncbi:MAG: hypothetical protein C0524_04410 [Rhodobacter sp.]|nr:hypothetical protein [Rhodobacter sp.]